MARRLPPKGAVFEAALSDRVALWDVSHLLPVNPRRSPKKRDASKINRVFLHKSGGIGRAGFAGLLASVKYVIRKRHFPGAAYTFWIPRKPDRDSNGRLVVYRCNRDDVRSWHTGGRLNVEAVAVALQGNPSLWPLSWQQKATLPALLRWCLSAYPLDDQTPISTHSKAKSFGARKSKSVCPGRFAESWLRRWLVKEGL